ncbi:LOW QUALITY PROTEIN: olfactory receptor 4K13-like [Enhydra lutris kenyoni]|uniref:Olfactory receptor n=1 Tax=Enhydra lutris kenyoni TaxID=391180 RepID=A0A2Y9L7P0_ENHLU|nr:LOW QUALITY PROTEIN: olfactory receptor 4K13-like [Enhydra lutris kenyoni]
MTDTLGEFTIHLNNERKDTMNSSISKFVLLGLTNTWELEIFFFFFIFLLAYAAIVAGSLLIVVTITFDSLLYSTPMYFLLGNLSFLDMSISTITTPKMVTDFLREYKTISLWGCMAQMFLLHFLGSSEMTLLIVMAVDRYIAICKPLHYTSIMNHRILVGAVLLSWAVGFVHTMSQMVFTITLPFCGPNIVDNIFCDFPLVLKLACTEIYILELLVIADSGLLSFICFILLLISYTVILVTVRGRSSGGLSKALSTLSAHITVVTLFFGPCIFIYAWPFRSFSVDKFLSVFYSVITPLLNPIIYTLRNQEMKAAMNRLRTQHIRSRQTF